MYQTKQYLVNKDYYIVFCAKYLLLLVYKVNMQI